jgi:hypothetical protein
MNSEDVSESGHYGGNFNFENDVNYSLWLQSIRTLGCSFNLYINVLQQILVSVIKFRIYPNKDTF